MTIDLDHLEAAAKAATPGPWRTSRKYGEHDDIVRTEWSTQSKKARDVLIGGARAFGRDHRGHIRIIEAIGPQWEANAAYIAAANPAVVLELIAELRKARAERDWLANDIATKDGNCPPIPQDCTDIVFCSPDVCKQCWLEAARKAVEKKGKE